MRSKSLRVGVAALLSMLSFALGLAGQPPQAAVRQEPARLIIEAEGTETASPDLIHLLMKMESQAGLAVDAARAGEKQLGEFLAAVVRLRISKLTYRVTNDLITPASAGPGEFSGFVYARNIIFTFPLPPPGTGDVDRLVAQIEDLGARYNSHCVTCIGSG